MGTLKNGRLGSLLDDAYKTCIELRDFTKNNFYVFEGDDDDKIVEFVQERQKYLDTLAKTEYEFDRILEDAEKLESVKDLPSEMEDIRRSIRSVLDEIEAFDFEAIKRVSGKMQEYKVQTMKARNQKHLSSYFMSDDSTQAIFDCKK